MTRQLVLIETTRHDWSLDDKTKEIGKRGVEAAREALRLARLDSLRHDQSSAA